MIEETKLGVEQTPFTLERRDALMFQMLNNTIEATKTLNFNLKKIKKEEKQYKHEYIDYIFGIINPKSKKCWYKFGRDYMNNTKYTGIRQDNGRCFEFFDKDEGWGSLKGLLQFKKQFEADNFFLSLFKNVEKGDNEYIFFSPLSASYHNTEEIHNEQRNEIEEGFLEYLKNYKCVGCGNI